MVHRILWFKYKITGSHKKKKKNDVWLRIEIPTWILYESQIWVQSFTCFWIKAGLKSGLNSFVSPSLLPFLGPPSSFLPIFSISHPVLLCLSLSPLGHYRARTVMPDYPCNCEQNLRLRRGQCLQHLTNQIRKLYVLEPSQVQRQWACRPYLMGKRPIT